MTTRLDVLDGLRGIAVLLVLWYHVWEITWLPANSSYTFIPATGFVGVHLFFYISGFVIAYPFVRALAAGTAQPSWGHFANRRTFKIVPSYLASIALAYAIGYAQTQTWGAGTAADLGTHLLFVHTWFANTQGSINGVLWTLGVEVQFYLLFPFIWLLFKRSPWATAAGMILIAWAWRSALHSCCASTTFALLEENLPGYLDIFACGILSAYLYVRFHARWSVTAVRRATGALLAVLGIFFALWLMHAMYDFRTVDQWSGVWQVDRRPLFGLAFMGIALGSLVGIPAWRRAIANPLLVFMGAISYNLYLYSQLISRELLWHRVPGWTGSDPHLDFHWQIAYTVVAALVSIAFATLTTYAFEQPILRATAHFTRARPVGDEQGALSGM